MLAMQYEISLPADYDMQRIRDRVGRTGHLLDAYPGLGLKAYLIREHGVDGSAGNQYAVLAADAKSPGVHSTAYAVDSTTWQLVTLTLTIDRPEVSTGTIYQVLHLAAPEASQLPSEVTRRLQPRSER